jgi:hypothetical protein
LPPGAHTHTRKGKKFVVGNPTSLLFCALEHQQRIDRFATELCPRLAEGLKDPIRTFPERQTHFNCEIFACLPPGVKFPFTYSPKIRQQAPHPPHTHNPPPSAQHHAHTHRKGERWSGRIIYGNIFELDRGLAIDNSRGRHSDARSSEIASNAQYCQTDPCCERGHRNGSDHDCLEDSLPKQLLSPPQPPLCTHRAGRHAQHMASPGPPNDKRHHRLCLHRICCLNRHNNCFPTRPSARRTGTHCCPATDKVPHPQEI